MKIFQNSLNSAPLLYINFQATMGLCPFTLLLPWA